MEIVLDVPIGLVKILVPQITGEKHQMVIQRRLFLTPPGNDPGRKSVTKIVETGMEPTPVTLNAMNQAPKRRIDGANL